MCVRQMRPPVGGLLDSENCSCPLFQKPAQKRFLPPERGSLFCGRRFCKKIFGAGTDAVERCVRHCAARGGQELATSIQNDSPSSRGLADRSVARQTGREAGRPCPA